MSKKFFALISAALVSAFGIAIVPMPSSADVCQGSQCQVTFSYTGASQIWSVPSGASNITFDVQGAAGGRGGGLGGRVTGLLTGSYTQLHIYVGGAGQTGSIVDGGFNGGGKSGGNRTNEGSGGGASDIRLSNSLESRLVVAGGGGGTGGFSGGPGGHGGGEIASAGQAGQGGGGGGGTQVAGGIRGSNNGGYVLATNGSFGEGGVGGVSWNAGGGGGGGGWYGGGGGGSDEDDCCGDGGGGGGGSSYAASSDTMNVLHTSGFKSGHGVVIISYELTPQLVDFSGSQLNTNSVLFTLEYNMQLSGVELTDFNVVGNGCTIAALQTIGNRQEILVENCSANPELTIPANSFRIFAAEPQTTLSATVVLDQAPPIAEFSHSVSSQSSIVLQVTISEAVNVASSSSFQILGCESYSVTTSPAVELQMNNCFEGDATVLIQNGTFQDQFGNTTDTISHSVQFDYTAPVLSWGSPEVRVSETFDVSLRLVGSEPFDLNQSALQITGSAQSCSHSVSREARSYLVSLTSCNEGELLLELAANSVVDSAENLAPTSPLLTRILIARPLPVGPGNSYPIVSAPDVFPEPQTSSQEVIASPPTQSPVSIPVAEDELESSQPERAPSFAENIAENQAASNQELPQSVTASNAPATTPSANNESIAQPAVFEVQEPQQQNRDIWLAGLVVLAILSLGGAGAVLMRLAENNRSRTIK